MIQLRYLPCRCLEFLISQASFTQGYFIIARPTHCTETQQIPPILNSLPPPKNTVVTSPPACCLIGQQCDTRRYLSLPRRYVTPTLACRTARVCLRPLCFLFASNDFYRYAPMILQMRCRIVGRACYAGPTL